jgi:hypothetical protein
MDRTGKVPIGIPATSGHLVLRAIGMNRIAMTEPVGVIVAQDRLPGLVVPNLQLHGVLKDPLVTTPKGTAHPHLVGQEAASPIAFDNPCAAHLIVPLCLPHSNLVRIILQAIAFSCDPQGAALQSEPSIAP